MLSAQVILQISPGSGRDDPRLPVEAVPSKKTISTIMASFEKLGFETGHFAGNSFSITAAISTFEKVFSTQIVSNGNAHVVQWKDGALKDHFPLQDLPESLTGLLSNVILPATPDFGPENY